MVSVSLGKYHVRVHNEVMCTEKMTSMGEGMKNAVKNKRFCRRSLEAECLRNTLPCPTLPYLACRRYHK